MSKRPWIKALIFLCVFLLVGGLMVSASPAGLDSEVAPATTYATTIIVNSGLDLDTSGSGITDGQPVTLRRAIVAARNATKPVLIQFDIPTTCPSYNASLGVWKIELLGIGTGAPANTTFRQLNGEITIDGGTQPGGRINGPKIILYGHGATGSVNCMVLGETATQGGNVIRGLGFQNFNDSITVSSVNNTIEDCWFGLNDAGTASQLRGNNPASGSGDTGVAMTNITTNNNNNMIQNNKFLGLNGTAATIRGRDNTFRVNQIGMTANGTVPNPGCSPDSWLGGGGLDISGRRHIIEGNWIAGLRFDQFDLSQPPDAMRITADDVAGSGHFISSNYIGWDMNSNPVGTCGRGIYVSNHMRGTIIDNNIIVNTTLPGISMNGLLYNECELSTNIIRETSIEYGPALPDSFKNFKPPKVTSIQGTTVIGTSGDGSPAPNVWVELFLDETNNPAEAREWLARVQADANGNWQATLPFELIGNQGIRTTLTTTQFGIIPGRLAGTSTGLSELYRPQITGDFLYASFADAVYAYDGSQWLPTPVAHAPSLALTPHGGNLYGAFADGIYVYDRTSWDINKITPGVASNMASYNNKLYGSFADATYVYDGSLWAGFTWPTHALASYQGYLYASFSDAVYAYDGNNWIETPIAHAPALALSVHDGKLYGAFEDGVYVYDGSSWDVNKITPGVASNMASHEGRLYGCFADATYVYDGNQWTLFTWITNALAAY